MNMYTCLGIVSNVLLRRLAVTCCLETTKLVMDGTFQFLHNFRYLNCIFRLAYLVQEWNNPSVAIHRGSNDELVAFKLSSFQKTSIDAENI
jgi:hypothetical protein